MSDSPPTTTNSILSRYFSMSIFSNNGCAVIHLCFIGKSLNIDNL